MIINNDKNNDEEDDYNIDDDGDSFTGIRDFSQYIFTST